MIGISRYHVHLFVGKSFLCTTSRIFAIVIRFSERHSTHILTIRLIQHLLPGLDVRNHFQAALAQLLNHRISQHSLRRFHALGNSTVRLVLLHLRTCRLITTFATGRQAVKRSGKASHLIFWR